MDIAEKFQLWRIARKVTSDDTDRQIIKYISQGEKIPYISMILKVSEKTIDRRLKKMRNMVKSMSLKNIKRVS